MITSRAWAGKRFGVYGLARSGAATVDALLASGAEVVAWDEGSARVDHLRSSRAKSRDAGIERVSTSLDTSGLWFEDLNSADLSTLDALVVSPGVPLNTHPLAARARAAGVPVIGDIELFSQARAELPPHKAVGITGTNGKSTTTALVHHILRTAGVPTVMGGNIGLPILEQEPLPEGGVYVLELSSYQLDLTQSLACEVAVLLNITPDHLDRYESFEAYAASKRRLFAMQGPKGIAIGGHDEALAGEGLIEIDTAPLAERQPDWPALQGPHNAANAAAALVVAAALEVPPGVTEAALRTFRGLPHRMELVGEHRGVRFVNDSKATNPEAAAPALAAFDQIHWILGGQAKSSELSPCEPYMGHVRHAYLIGEAAPIFQQVLAGRVPATDCGDLDQAVSQAAARAERGDTVLLSPACASFDQFCDFEDRGDRFRALVGALT